MSPSTRTSSITDQVDDVQITGEKRKADSSSTSDQVQEKDAGGKDLVETKQTTLDDVIQHEKKESESVPQPSAPKSDPTTESVNEGGPVTKKSKIDPESESEIKTDATEEGRMDIDGEKAKGAKTPPSQSSQTGPLDRPHKSVKRVDNIADKPITGTPTKSINRGKGDLDNADASSSSPLKPNPTNGNGSSRTDGVKGVGSGSGAGAGAGAGVGGDDSETVPGDEAHLDHPENWTTGDEPATEKQKGYLKVLESQKGVSVGDISSIWKSEASEKIDQLVAGKSSTTSSNTNTSASTTSVPAAAAAAGDSTETTTKTSGGSTTNAASGAADAETVPGDEAHLDHPENWTTGGEPATDKQKGFLKVLEKQKGVEVGDISSIGKSEASEKIDELKNM